LTAEELDFILNYDTRLRSTTSFRLRALRFDGQVGGLVKYRLGRDAGEEE